MRRSPTTGAGGGSGPQRASDWPSLQVASRNLDLVAGDRAIEVAAPAWHPLDLDLVLAGRYGIDVDGKEHEFRVPETRTFKLP